MSIEEAPGLKSSRIGTILVAAGLVCATMNLAGQSDRNTSSVQAKDGVTQSDPSHSALGVEFLSDTRGVDFGPYIKQVLTMIKASWMRFIPEEARPPGSMKGETVIRFTINSDGKLSAMHLDGRSGQSKLDRAAWGAITSISQFPPLPEKFTGPNLELRPHFTVNLPPPTTK
jgi:TonB family protein